MTTIARTDASITDGTCRRFRPVVTRDEEKERRRQVAELAARFPDRTAVQVERAVEDAWHDLEAARLRDFAPVLAMKAAVAQLGTSATARVAS